MSEYDQKERVLTGDIAEAEDRDKLAKVRASLRDHVRIGKGLPQDPVNLDVDILSQLPNSPVIEDPIRGKEPKVVSLDISRLPAEHSVVGLVKHQERLKKIAVKKAA